MRKIIIILSFAFIATSTNAQYSIEGYVHYNLSAGLPVSDVTLQLKKASDNTIVGNPVITNSKGYYNFDDIPNGKYIINCTTYHMTGGINPTDALLVNKNFLYLYTFTDSLKKKAANVNADKYINPVDALLINKKYIQTISTFKAGAWLFAKDTITVNGNNVTYNIKGLCYGDVDGSFKLVFNCGDILVDARDQQEYKTVQIGNQCWMKQNLAATKITDGKDIPLVTDNTEWINLNTPGYCWFNNDAGTYKDSYGAMYNWYAVNTGKLCPSGWHVPAEVEWQQLELFLGESQADLERWGWSKTDLGLKMKEEGTTHWVANNNSTNESGFTALPGGYRDYYSGNFYGIGVDCYMWAATENPPNNGWVRTMYNGGDKVSRIDQPKKNGYTVRCIMNCPEIDAPGQGINTPSQEQIIWNWTAVTGATGYKWNTTNNYNTATDNGTGRNYTQSGLTCNTSYTLYVWAYNNCGNYSAATLTQSTSACPCPSVYPPHNGTNTASQDQIIWRWLVVTGASGYKWNSTNDYSTAIDNGISTSITQSGLNCNTPYSIYVWAYNSCDEHSNPSFLMQTTSECPSTFKCGDNLVDSRDSKSYKTVLIGTQCWMKENINIGTRINGTNEQADNGTIERFCYNDDENNCNVYGGLYKWNEAMQYVTTDKAQGICPAGWHIPSEEDWGIFISYIGGINTAGGKMKKTGFAHWASPNTGATDSYNFTALGAGFWSNTAKNYYYLTNRTYIWSSTQSDASNAYERGPLYNFANPSYGAMPKAMAASVRCIKD